MFNKLSFIDPNIYKVNKTREFVSVLNVNGYTNKIFDFAYAMTFAQSGHHRNHRSGGKICRNNAELFVNVFQGKVAEFAVYRYFLQAGILIDEPDLSVLGEGFWDSSDFCCYGYKISVKSAAHFSNLLLLEKADWNEKGEYTPNLDSVDAHYDFFIFCRVKPDTKSFLKHINKLYKSDGDMDYIALKQFMLNGQSWKVDFPGCISHNNLCEVIKSAHILPKKALLNGKIEMDADNYYVQSGDMRPIEKLIKYLKEKS